MVDAIDLARKRHRLHLWAYAVMPEHVHVVFWPTETNYSISSILTTMKQSVSKRSLAFVKVRAPQFLRRMEDRRPDGSVTHRFWQRGGGYDRNLIEPGTVVAELEYVNANPVRRGLCERVADWHWSSAAEYERPGSGPLRLDLGSLPMTST